MPQCRRVHPVGLPILWILLQLTVCLERTSCDAGEDVESSALEVGSCFKERRKQGNCFGLLSKVWSKAKCCKRNGFFVNRLISEEEYLTDHLLFESGTPFCFDACYEEITPSCVGYRCSPGHTCQLVNNQPKCVCQLSCNTSDYLSGPVCSNDLRRFDNQCLFKRAVCLSPMESLEEIVCPKEAAKCAPDSVFPGQCMEMLQSMNVREKRVQEENFDESADPWLFGELGNFFLGLFNKRSRTFHMHRRRYVGPPSNDDQHRKQYKTSGKAELQMSNYFSRSSRKGNWKHCPAGEYCLIRQYDSQPGCIPLAITESVILNDCPQEGIFPEPMCGVDNQTYVNACQLRNVSLKRQLEVRIAYRGACHKDANCSYVRCLREGMTCRPHHETGQPVCLDCRDLPQNCNAYTRQEQQAEEDGGPSVEDSREKRVETDRSRAGALAGALGDPHWSSVTVTTDWPAVCGSNGRTYANSCFLHIFNCYSPVFVDLSMPGLCPGHL